MALGATGMLLPANTGMLLPAYEDRVRNVSSLATPLSEETP